jgi:SAM-dependent MidA family methyltransferase
LTRASIESLLMAGVLPRKACKINSARTDHQFFCWIFTNRFHVLTPNALELPEPGPAALAHSAALVEHIHQAIDGAGGWISFADFMRRALYTPGLGYYSAGATKLGAAGDFVTAPELSPLFAECVGGQIAQVLRTLDGGSVLEPGAGLGTMAAGILLELERQNALPQDYFILEPSADLRERQRQTIAAQAGHLLERVSWLDQGPAQPINGVIVANEVADALPCARFIIDETQADRVSELGVMWVDEQLANSARRASGELLKGLVPIFDLPDFQPAHGYTSELNLQLPGWVKSIADWIDQGVVLMLDYGFSRAEYYRSERSAGTLRCFYQHRAHEDPFVWPGLQDISAWVDFTLLAESAAAAGLHVAGYTTQAQFLLASDIAKRFESREFATSAERAMAAQGVQRLILPGEMGETVKVMALASGDIDVPAGMLGRDLRGSL